MSILVSLRLSASSLCALCGSPFFPVYLYPYATKSTKRRGSRFSWALCVSQRLHFALSAVSLVPRSSTNFNRKRFVSLSPTLCGEPLLQNPSSAAAYRFSACVRCAAESSVPRKAKETPRVRVRSGAARKRTSGDSNLRRSSHARASCR